MRDTRHDNERMAYKAGNFELFATLFAAGIVDNDHMADILLDDGVTKDMTYTFFWQVLELVETFDEWAYDLAMELELVMADRLGSVSAQQLESESELFPSYAEEMWEYSDIVSYMDPVQYNNVSGRV